LRFLIAPAMLASSNERMPKRSNKPSQPAVHPRIRVVIGGDIALGPGKVELLAQLEATGSIAEAARRLGMSYMRAWKLVRTMERCFKLPLLAVARGGQRGGGAALTENGRKALELYHRMESESLRASEPLWRELRQLLRES
jgi:molybdate transport system regulatory protein